MDEGSAHRKAAIYIEHKHRIKTQTPVPSLAFEPRTPVIERASGPSATLIGVRMSLLHLKQHSSPNKVLHYRFLNSHVNVES
jgi:hypothetical protein